jgi:propanol-preferring alcohol dehydrogenase
MLTAAGGPILAVLNFVNSAATVPLALGVLTKGGRIIQVGVMGGELNLSPVGLVFKAVTIMDNNTGTSAPLNSRATARSPGV